MSLTFTSFEPSSGSPRTSDDSTHVFNTMDTPSINGISTSALLGTPNNASLTYDLPTQTTGNGFESSLMSMSAHEQEEVRLFCDKATNFFKLDVDQCKRLKQHILINRDGPIGMMKEQIWVHADTISMFNSLKASLADQAGVHELVKNANAKFSTKFELIKEHKEILQAIGKECFIDPTRTSFHDVHLTIQKLIENQPALYGLSDLVGNPAAQKALRDYAKDAAKNAGQQLRTQLLISVKGEESARRGAKLPTTLEEFTWKLVDSWKSGGLGSNTGVDYQCRFAVMRKFTYAIWDGNDMDEDNENTNEEPPAKQKKGGRSSKETSFWGKFSSFLEMHIGKNGSNLKTEGWSTFIAECVREDWKRFGKDEYRLQALPVTMTLQLDSQPVKATQPRAVDQTPDLFDQTHSPIPGVLSNNVLNMMGQRSTENRGVAPDIDLLG
ncbi:hypothetical protein EV361DRAFT_943302 [Lentinula raphanica]|nr:hypothetical protein EV361DRAFT_943302 [Lentinula raphanica]